MIFLIFATKKLKKTFDKIKNFLDKIFLLNNITLHYKVILKIYGKQDSVADAKGNSGLSRARYFEKI